MKVSRENRRRKELGLSHVTLLKVEVRRCPKCGQEEVAIPRIEQLHKLLAGVLARKKGPLSGEEVRFLRTYLGWSQADFAQHAGVTRETVSRWENERELFAGTADRFLRLAVVQWGPVEHYEMRDLDAANEPAQDSFRIGAEPKVRGWELALL